MKIRDLTSKFSSSSLKSNIKKGIIIYSLWMVAFIIIAEIALRHYRRKPPTYEDKTGFENYPFPYVMFKMKPHLRRKVPNEPMSHWKTDGDISINSMGFRDDEIPPKGKNEFRVFILGGSVVVNGSSLEMTISRILQREMRKKTGGDHIKVYNTGIYSCKSAQESILLYRELIPLKPDMIIVFDGVNDFQYFYDPRPDYPFNYFAVESAINYFRENQEENILRHLYNLIIRNSQILSRVFEPDNFIKKPPSPIEEKNPDMEKVAQWRKALLKAYLGNIKQMTQLCQGHNIKGLFILQPVRFLHKNYTSWLKDVENPLYGKTSHEHFYWLYSKAEKSFERQNAYWAASSDNNEEIVSGEFEKFGLDVSDYNQFYYASFARIFDDQKISDTYWDFVHFFDEGNVKVAQKMMELIEQHFDIPTRKSIMADPDVKDRAAFPQADKLLQ